MAHTRLASISAVESIPPGANINVFKRTKNAKGDVSLSQLRELSGARRFDPLVQQSPWTTLVVFSNEFEPRTAAIYTDPADGNAELLE